MLLQYKIRYEGINMNMYLKFDRNTVCIEGTEYLKPETIFTKVEDFLFEQVGGRTYLRDTGWREPDYKEVHRRLKKKNWLKLQYGAKENDLTFILHDDPKEEMKRICHKFTNRTNNEVIAL